MIAVRWNKVARDLSLAKGRIGMMIAAVGLSLAAVAGILSAYAVLGREISVNYLGTNPASATLKTGVVSDDLVRSARSLPQVKDAEARRSILARVKVRGGEWQPLLLFVVRDFNDMRIGKAKPEVGDWPPPRGTLLLERTVLPFFGVKLGDQVLVRTPKGTPATLTVSGTAHDPGLAPAWQERMGYGYIALETLETLGEAPFLDELKIVTTGPSDTQAITQASLDVAAWLKDHAHPVVEIEIPPPNKHPHQNQMGTILLLLLVFSFSALLLSAILVAAMIAGMMSKETRNVGIMKTIGADTGQVMRLYLGWSAFVGLAGLAWGIPLGMLLGRGVSSLIAEMLNFNLFSSEVPWWVYGVVVLSGLLVPVAISLVPVLRASSLTVREAIAGSGTAPRKTSRLNLKLGLSRTLEMSLRNSFRKRGRLVLTLLLMAVGGSLFLSALNVQTAWKAAIDEGFASRHYDYAIRLTAAQPTDEVLKLLRSFPGVHSAEAWGYAEASTSSTDGVEISHRYPDGGHGSFSLIGVKQDTSMVNFPLVAGRWLAKGDTGVVLNQSAWAKYANAPLGSKLSINAEGQEQLWTLVGVVREIGQPEAYVTDGAFQSALSLAGRARDYLVSGSDLAPIESALDAKGFERDIVVTSSVFREAIDGHILILIDSLLAMALIMGVVGLLGLGSATNLNVLERTREIGILRSVGATPGVILRNILSEALFVGLLSLAAASLLALPLSLFLGNLLGNLAFLIPLPLSISPAGLGVWTLAVTLGSLFAAAPPALRASRLSIRETLAYE